MGGVLGGIGSVLGGDKEDVQKVDNPNSQNYQYGGSEQYAANKVGGLEGQAGMADARRGQGTQTGAYDTRAQEQYYQAQNARGQQQGLADSYQAVLNGTAGPSLAEQQMRAGMQQGAQNALNMAANAGPQNAGLGLRNAMLAQQQSALGAAQQGGMMRAQEQAEARAALGGLLGGMRGQDAALLGQQYGQVNQANQNYYQQQGLNDARNQFYQQSARGVEQNALQGTMGYSQAVQNAQTANAAAINGKEAANTAMTAGLITEGAKAAGSGGATLAVR